MNVGELGMSEDDFPNSWSDCVKYRTYMVIPKGAGLIHKVLSMLFYSFLFSTNAGVCASSKSWNKVDNGQGGINKEKEFSLDR